MVEIVQGLSLGGIILRLAVILVLTIGAIIVSRLILKRLIWPVIKKTKTKTKAANKTFLLSESILLSLIILQGTQAAVRLFSKYFSLYAEFIDNFFFLLYWSIGGSCLLI